MQVLIINNRVGQPQFSVGDVLLKALSFSLYPAAGSRLLFAAPLPGSLCFLLQDSSFTCSRTGSGDLTTRTAWPLLDISSTTVLQIFISSAYFTLSRAGKRLWKGSAAPSETWALLHFILVFKIRVMIQTYLLAVPGKTFCLPWLVKEEFFGFKTLEFHNNRSWSVALGGGPRERRACSVFMWSSAPSLISWSNFSTKSPIDAESLSAAINPFVLSSCSAFWVH